MFKKIILNPWLAVLSLILILSVRFYDPNFVESVRLRYFDQLIINQAPKAVDIHTVNIDEAALTKYGQWPFPRDIYAEIIRDLYKRGAGLVVFNVLMPEVDRSGKDSALANTMKQFAVVLPTVASNTPKNPSIESSVQVLGLEPADYLKAEYSGLISNIKVLEENAIGSGIVNTFPEVDAVVRRLPLVVLAGDSLYPALSMESIRVSVNSQIQVKVGEQGVEAVRIPDVGRIDTDGLGRIWFDWSVQPTEHSLANLPTNFNNGIVVVGLAAAGLVNPISTAKGEVWPQYLQAVAMGTIASGGAIKRPESADNLEVAALALTGLLLIFLMRWTYVGLAATVVIIAGSIASSYYLYSNHLLLFDATAFAVGTTLVALHAFMTKFLSEFLQKQQIKKQFGGYVNPVIVERLQRDPDFIKLGGEKRDLSIIMSDMRNFTGLGETYGDDVVAFTNTMNRYMTAIAEPILRNNGCLIKFIGDASLHVHGAPIQEAQDPDHVLAAVRTGLEMLHAVELFNIELAKEGKPLVGMGLGINTGPTLIGNIGSKDRFGYDVLGDSVSLTARLEGQTKNYGVLIIISEFTQARIGDEYFTIELDTIAVKGKSVGVTIYTVFYNPDVTVAADWIMARDMHDGMLTYYRQQKWDLAIELCQELVGEFDGRMDDYYVLWQERIAEMRVRDLPADWDGTYRATSK